MDADPVLLWTLVGMLVGWAGRVTFIAHPFEVISAFVFVPQLPVRERNVVTSVAPKTKCI